LETVGVKGHPKAATWGQFKTGHFRGEERKIDYILPPTTERRKNGQRFKNGKADSGSTATGSWVVLP